MPGLALAALLLLCPAAGAAGGAGVEGGPAPDSAVSLQLSDLESLLREGGAPRPPLSPAAPVRRRDGSKAIIGADGRLEYYEAPRELRRLADSVAALVHADAPGFLPASEPPLCPTERFWDQPVRAFCAGFLAAPDIIATAGHCVSERNCANTVFVFDYAVRKPGVMPPDEFKSRNVYSCSRVLMSYFTPKSRADDFALVQLDRPVTGRRPLKVNLSGEIAPEGTPLLAIGFFLGKPLKVSLGGEVRLSTSVAEHSENRWFTTSLDTFQGNSGGPIINERTLQVEGIQARAGGRTEPSFRVTPEGCREAVVYDPGEPWGPECTSVAPFVNYFRQLEDYSPD